ncbi:MAG: hypothetical protein U0V87_14525 [Acidobacteriota bacterium]
MLVTQRTLRLAPVALLSAALGFFCPATASEPLSGGVVINQARVDYQPGTLPVLVRVGSNIVRTPVIPPCSSGSTQLTLRVTPRGSVQPGAMLDYQVAVKNNTSAALLSLAVQLPIDVGLQLPESFTSGPTTATPDRRPTTIEARLVVETRTVIWTIDQLDPGQTVRLALRSAVRGDLPPRSSITMQARARPSECTGELESNDVVTAVVVPVLRVSKRAESSSAAPGDTVGYSIQLQHTGIGPPLTSVEAIDRLPELLRYVPGSARRDGRKLPDPVISKDGRTLRFAVGAMSAGDTVVLRFAAVVGPTAEQGEAINHASAIGIDDSLVSYRSNEASAAIGIVPGPFRREAHLIGRVFIDDNGDGLPGVDEPGVPGVLVALEDGTGSVTDITGRWHIEAVRPGLHALRLDPATLPTGLTPATVAEDPDNPASLASFVEAGASRLIEVRPATLAVADFSVAPRQAARCTIRAGELVLWIPTASLISADETQAQTASRYIAAAAALIAERGLGQSAASIECQSVPGVTAPATEELQARLRTALIERDNRERHVDLDLPAAPSAPTESAAPIATDSLEPLVRTATSYPAIVSPASGARADRSSIAVEVVYRMGNAPRLTVNGKPIGDDRIGATASLPSRQVAASRYIGVPLQPGANRLLFQSEGTDGALSEAVETMVFLPSEPVALRVAVANGPWIADPSRGGELLIEAIDGAGMRTTDAPVVTIVLEGAQALDPDLDPDLPGLQLRLEDGQRHVHCAPLTTPGIVRVAVYTQALRVESIVNVAPNNTHWRLSGLAEAHVAGAGGVEGEGGWGPGIEDQVSSDGGRVALFARGPISDRAQLTVSLDTARERDRNRLFGSPEPDRFYTVYGDAAQRTDEAERQGPLYARVDLPSGFVQWGDFSSGFDRSELARYDRRLSGLSTRAQRGRLAFEGFASSSDQSMVRDLFAPDGSSGPYLLTQRQIVARSETVIVETRDRFRPEQVLQRQIKVRDLDYSLDTESGTILFRAPLAPFDRDLNPTRVVVLYESRGVRDELTAGGRLAMHWSDRLETGLSMVREGREGGARALAGVDLNWRPAAGVEVGAEWAESQNGSESAANAMRLDLRYRRSARFGWDLGYRDIDSGFDNPSLLGSPEVGSRRVSATMQWQPSDPWRVRGEALSQVDHRSGFSRRVAALRAERALGALTALFGARYASADGAGLDAPATTQLEAGLRARFARRWNAELLRSQSLGNDDVPGYPTRTAVGLGFEWRTGRRLFLRQEFESSGGRATDRTVLGLETQLTDRTRALARYSLEEGATGSALRATTGLETTLPLTAHSSLSGSLARVDTSRGDDSGDYTTLGGAYEYRAGTSLFSTRYELHLGQRDTRHLLTAAGAFRPRDPWTIFVRDQFSLDAPQQGTDSKRSELLMGAAFRPLVGRWQFLTRVDARNGWGDPSGTAGIVAGVFNDFGGSVTGTPGSGTTSRPPGIGIGAPREAPGVLRDAVSLAFAVGARLDARQRLAATLIVRQVQGDAIADATLTQLVSLHYTARVMPRWTLGGSVRRYAQAPTAMTSYGVGVEGGYMAWRGLWITAGYNLIGFDDGDFPGAERTARGFFLSLRFSFDEQSLQQLSSLRLDRP